MEYDNPWDQLDPALILPSDVLHEVLAFLPLEDLSRVRRLNRRWKMLADSDAVWRIRLIQAGWTSVRKLPAQLDVESALDDEDEDEQLRSTLIDGNSLRNQFIRKYTAPRNRFMRLMHERLPLTKLFSSQVNATADNFLPDMQNFDLSESLNRFPKLKAVLEGKKELISAKLAVVNTLRFSAVRLLFSAAVLFLTEYYYPNFFDYPYLWMPFHMSNVLRYWGLFVATAVVAFPDIATNGIQSTEFDNSIFIWYAFFVILTGVTEEIGYRWIFVCTSMLGIVFANYLVKVVLAGVSLWCCVLFIRGLRQRFAGNGNFAVVVFIALVAISAGLLVPYDLIYSGYEMTVYFTNMITLGFFEDIFYGKHPKLFIYGISSANAGFRDAKKYAGVRGMISAWIVGFVMMDATLSYGLLTAIVLHALYDLEFVVIRFISRKFVGKRSRLRQVLPL
eukprot:TRINITY_DN9251_c0_g1_i1.p1 TRINITY_DN9251_c0_g1~~TRINITY_DN9251_c0_g1_i1.p1  ORF type:complete len:448 (-),score=66.81 TRINITY_DN9251_c0_g1_i1:150-1493(-)